MEPIEVFQILGIEQTKDERALKNAYRDKLTVTNPEDDPEGFKRLRMAYEEACRYAGTPDAEENEEAEPTLEDDTPAGQWVRGVRKVYENITDRCDVEKWKALFEADDFLSLEEEENCTTYLLRFLMEHYKLPTAIWKLLDEKIHIVQNAGAFRERFPAQFVSYMVHKCESGEEVDFSEFRGAEDADYDQFLQYYDRAYQALQEKKLQEAEQMIGCGDALGITHPVMDTFVGIQNYLSVFQDSTFLHAFGFTAVFTVVSTVLINVFAFAIALVLTRGIKGTNLFRTVYFMPNLIGGILLGYIWQILLNGVLANLQKPLLALDAKAGFVGLVILMCWQQIGYMMIIYVAGLQSVPGDLIEAAKIDGANDREILFKIKIPMVMPSVTICTFLTLTNSFKLFDQNVALTAGEPANASEMLALNIYNTFYGRSGAQWKGIGQAKAVVFFLIVVVISLIQLHFTRSKEVQQ